MIQDIAPHHFDNQYHPRPPKTDDGVLLYRKGRVYMQEDGHIPAVRELCGEDRDRLQYLFSIDERAYYTLLQEAKQLPAGYAFLALNVLRTLRDRVAAMAAVSGHQLWNWYQTHLFCGSCGRSMRADEKEPLLSCSVARNYRGFRL